MGLLFKISTSEYASALAELAAKVENDMKIEQDYKAAVTKYLNQLLELERKKMGFE